VGSGVLRKEDWTLLLSLSLVGWRALLLLLLCGDVSSGGSISNQMSFEWAYVGGVEMVSGSSRRVRCSYTGKTPQVAFV
jgi:hypothetical protein